MGDLRKDLGFRRAKGRKIKSSIKNRWTVEEIKKLCEIIIDLSPHRIQGRLPKLKLDWKLVTESFNEHFAGTSQHKGELLHSGIGTEKLPNGRILSARSEDSLRGLAFRTHHHHLKEILDWLGYKHDTSKSNESSQKTSLEKEKRSRRRR
ncbi:hypothetical protein NHQ30_007869 [Ciborinia camelliae]|nr:hypothetical protein NHQ30_007869 [Ciborinia camelliae]